MSTTLLPEYPRIAGSPKAEPVVPVSWSSLLADGLWPNLLLTLFGVAAMLAEPVPRTNEWTYLVLLARQWNPEYLAGDWALSIPDHKHLVFNLVCGWPTLFVSPQVLGWAGRIGCWVGIVWFLFRIGDRLGVRRLGTTAAILLWVALRQSLFAGEWVLGGFEAKCVAYVFLFASIDGYLGGRRTWSAIALGLCFSFHPAVGLWSGLALGASLVVMRTPIRRLLWMATFVVLAALPGALPLLLAGAAATPTEELRFQVITRMPYHFDPSTFDVGAMLTGIVLLAFNLRVAWLRRDEPAWHLFGWLQFFAAGAFGLGVVARLFEKWAFLVAMPFRLFPFLVLLMFFWTLFSLLERRGRPALGPATLLLAGLGLMCLSNPVVAAWGRLQTMHRVWTRTPTDEERALFWIRDHTPAESVVQLAPRQEAPYLLLERPLVAAGYCPVGHMGEWRLRLEALRGDDWSYDPTLSLEESTQRKFDARSEAEVLDCVRRYGGDYLVGRADYSFPLVHEVGEYRVYELPTPPTKVATSN